MAARRVKPDWGEVCAYARRDVTAHRLDAAMSRQWRSWPARVPLDAWPGSLAEQAAGQRLLADKARDAGCDVVTKRTRKAGAHVSVDEICAVSFPSEDILIAASGLVADVARDRSRVAELSSCFPWLGDDELRKAASLLIAPEVDDRLFSECVSYGIQLHSRDVSGLTPRQVAVEGFHAKWLDNGRNLAAVTVLSGRGGLYLASRPSHVRFTYLDPFWIAAGGRRRDSADSDDAAFVPAYEPDVVIVCENRDSALFFPPVIPDGVAVLGDGDAVAERLSSFAWLAEANRVFYWGDMDADGLEALAGARAVCPKIESIFMDMASFARYVHLGVGVDAKGDQIKVRVPSLKALEYLTSDEAALYDVLCSGGCDGIARIEQERILLADAVAELESGGVRVADVDSSVALQGAGTRMRALELSI